VRVLFVLEVAVVAIQLRYFKDLRQPQFRNDQARIAAPRNQRVARVSAGSPQSKRYFWHGKYATPEKENLQENARTTGEYFMGKLRNLADAHECMHEVRGGGLMIGVEVTDKALAKRIVNGLRGRGVLIGSEGPSGNVLKLRPPMPFRPAHVDIVLEALNATLLSLRL
jgi:hypothetical protein